MAITLQPDPIRDLELNLEVDAAVTQSNPPVYAFLLVHDGFSEMDSDRSSRQALYLHQLASELVKQGCHVDIFTRREQYDQPEIVEHRSGFRTIYLTAGPVTALPPTQVLDYLPSFVNAWLTFQHRFKHNYVLLQTSDWLSGWVGLQLKQQLGIPHVHTSWVVNALQYLCLKMTQTTSIRQSVEQMCLEQADCVVAGSPREVADLRQILLINGKIRVVPRGVDTQHFGAFSRTEARQQLEILPETRLILYVGSFAPIKGIRTLVEACSLLPKPFQLYLVNNSSESEMDSEEQQHIRTLVKQMNLGSCVTFTGTVPRSQLPAYYAAANVCVVPNYYEACGSVALESMASGTPVIAGSMSELCHVVRQGYTGLLVNPFNRDALATVIWDALDNPDRWFVFGLAGRHWVESRFSHTIIAAQMRDLYDSLTRVENIQVGNLPNQLTSIVNRKLNQPRRPMTQHSTEGVLNQWHRFPY